MREGRARGGARAARGRGGRWVAGTVPGGDREISRRKEEAERSVTRKKIMKRILEEGGGIKEIQQEWRGDDEVWEEGLKFELFDQGHNRKKSPKK